jgi:hypothetical protein
MLISGRGGWEFIELSWNGKYVDELELQMASRFSGTLPDLALCSLP